MPTHHLHISTGFMFMTALFVVAFVAVIFAFVRSMRNDRLDAERVMAEIKAEEEIRKANPVAFRSYDALAPRPASTMTQPSNFQPQQAHAQGYVANTYAPAAPVYAAHDPMLGLATGMLIGNALGGSHHHDTTIIERGADPTHTHTYTDSSASYSSSSSDSGFSYSDSSSSSSSYDSGSSSGGFDASW